MRLLTAAWGNRHFLYLLPLLLLGACQKNSNQPDAAVMSPTMATPGNLVQDGSLASLNSWPSMETYGGVIHSGKSGTVFSGNAPGTYNIYQKVYLPAKKFYEVSVKVDYTINNYAPAGIYVMDSAMVNTLGEFEKVYSSGTGETWQFVFYCKKPANVNLVIGFLTGINGKATFTDVTLAEYDYKPKISQSGFAAYLGKKFPLVFNNLEYDSTIDKIADYMNSVLLCRYEYYSDTTELPILDSLIGSDTAYAYFNGYRHSLDSITDSYCQKSSLSLGEILANEFNIPVRQIYMVIGGVGLHQFQEYWNPFADKWIIIDPCFNVRYVKNGVLLGDEEIDQSTAPNLMINYGQYFYYQTTGPLVQLWQELDILDVKDYYTITFPYS
jgi:hypothetical protein